MKRFFITLFITIFIIIIPAAGFGYDDDNRAAEVGKSIDRYLKRAQDAGWVGSVLAAQGETIIHAGGYGLADIENNRPQTADTVFCIGSITKQFTAAAILELEMKGKLKITDPIDKFFADVPPDKKEITLHHLLTHTAGFAGVLGDDYDPIGSEEFIKLALQSKLLFKPGERYEYSNVGYSLLGIIIEKVSGQGYEQFLYEELFKPAKMERTGYLRPHFTGAELAVGYRNKKRWGTALDHTWRADGPGWHLRANGGILSTVGDMHRWFLALQGDKVLSAEAGKKYFTPYVKEYPEGDTYYAYGWVIEKTGKNTTMIWHNGGNGITSAFMGWEQESGLFIVVSSSISGKIADNYAARISRIMAGSAIELPIAVRLAAGGRYRLPSGAIILASFDENDSLVIDFTEAEPLQLLSSSGKEEEKDITIYNRMIGDVLTGIKAGDFSALAKAWGEDLEIVKKRASIYWGSLQMNQGKIKSSTVLGTVSRPRYFLTYARVDFEKKSLFFTYVWLDGKLQDLRQAETLQRIYQAVSADIFIEPELNRTIALEKDEQGQPLLSITGPTGKTRAVKLEPVTTPDR